MSTLLFIPSGRFLSLWVRSTSRRVGAVRCCASSLKARLGKVTRGNLNWAPLHNHSDFSFLDGASHVPDLAKKAAEMGIPALALTDHGNMHGAILHIKSCTENGVKPIVGNEMYLVNGNIDDGSYDGKVHHLTVMAKNLAGYKNLVKMTSKSHLEGYRVRNRSKRPAVNKDILSRHRNGLIVLSGCLAGEIPQALLSGRYDVARQVAKWYQDVFKDDFYLEMMDHGLVKDSIVNPGIVQLGKDLGIKVVVTNDSHFTNESDCTAHDALLCIQTGKKLSDEKRMRYTGTEFFKSADEMMMLFNDMNIDKSEVETSLKNTLEVAEKVESYNVFNTPQIPVFPVPSDFNGTAEDYFRKQAREGLEERFRVKALTKEYHDRLDYELDLLVDKGFASYFLIVWDYIRYARENGVSVGPGRGSACGSLVAYALKITDIDPVEHALLFERFLNPERTSLPDIDTDFSVEGREKVIRYVSEKYGEDHVAQIVTFNRLSSRAVLRDCARVMGVPYDEADKLSKLVPVSRGKPAKLATLISNETPSKEFKEKYETNPQIRELVDIALILEGTNRTSGVHAAGVVIGAERLDNVVPLTRGKNEEVVTQYAMEDLEAVGLLKMDFLGLKNLSIIDITQEYVRKRENKQLPHLSELDLTDKQTYDLLSSGDLHGVFQLDASEGMQKIVEELRPSNIEDVSATLALYRPGPLDAGLVKTYIKRKHGREKVTYDHEQLKPILKNTYGVLIYQEQIMQVARDLGGYSLGQADILRRAMGKKKGDIMERERDRFVSGAVSRNIKEKTADALFTTMLNFAEYCFNKSHSTAYAFLTYQTAWLKANYPVEFIASVLRLNSDNMSKIPRYISDAGTQDVEVLAPSVNTSNVKFAPIYDLPKNSKATAGRRGYVGFGLGAVKGVGDVAAEAIVVEREKNGPYKSIFEFCSRLPPKFVGKRVLEHLVMCGAFDDLHGNRKAVTETIPDILEWRKKMDAKRKRRLSKGETEEEVMNDDTYDVEEDPNVVKIRESWEESSLTGRKFTPGELYKMEKELIGFYASGDLFKDFEEKLRMVSTEKLVNVVGAPISEPIESTSDLEGLEGGEDVGGQINLPPVEKESSLIPGGERALFAGVVTDTKIMRVKATGKPMLRFVLDDRTASCDCIVFSKTYPRLADIIETGKVIVVEAKVDRKSRGELHVETAKPLDDMNVFILMFRRDDFLAKEWGGIIESIAKSANIGPGGEPIPIRVAVTKRDEPNTLDVTKQLTFVPRVRTPEDLVNHFNANQLHGQIISIGKGPEAYEEGGSEYEAQLAFEEKFIHSKVPR